MQQRQCFAHHSVDYGGMPICHVESLERQTYGSFAACTQACMCTELSLVLHDWVVSLRLANVDGLSQVL